MIEKKGKRFYSSIVRASPSTTVKLRLDDQLVMGSNLETGSLHMIGEGCIQLPSPLPSWSAEPLSPGYINFFYSSVVCLTVKSNFSFPCNREEHRCTTFEY